MLHAECKEWSRLPQRPETSFAHLQRKTDFPQQQCKQPGR
jgi:hypothetical protein